MRTPRAEISTYQPVAGPTPTNAPCAVLYGVLSFAKRMSRYGRNTFSTSNSSSRAASIPTMGRFTEYS